MKRYQVLVGTVITLTAACLHAATTVTKSDAMRGSSSSDLLQTALDSVSTSGGFTGDGCAGAYVLTNGIAICSIAAQGTPNYANDGGTQAAGISSGATATYTLVTNTPATSEGYDITRIDIYHGWRDTGRDEGRVTVEYATASDPGTFTEIVNASSANYNPPSQYGRIRLGSDSGVFIATNAVKIRFTFPSQENGQAGYSELDVFGLAVSDVMLTPSGGSTDVDEGGAPATDTYTVYLRNAPTSTVTVTPSFNSSEITVTPASLTFTPGNYGNAQTCTVTVVDDSEIEQTHVTPVGHTVTSSDTNYDGTAVADLEVTITDNDVPGTTVTKTDSVLDCATNDLLETALDSVVGDVGGGEPILRDGEGGTRTLIPSGRYATYTLDTTTEPSGYRIEQIDIYHGWGDDGRDEGRVTVEYELLSNPEVFYEIVNTAVYDPPGTYGRIRLTPDTGTFFATGVSKIRFKFPATQENGQSGYAELDVIGSPPPPPPAGTIILFR